MIRRCRAALSVAMTGSNTWVIHSSANVSLDQPVWLVVHRQSDTRLITAAGRYLELKDTPLKTTRGGRAIPAALIHSIDVTVTTHDDLEFLQHSIVLPCESDDLIVPRNLD